MSRAASSTVPCARDGFRGLWRLPLVVVLGALVGCAALGLPGPKGGEPAAANEPALYLEAVRALIGQRQYYAAVAHIQQDRLTHGDTPELRLLEADARRLLGQNKASESLYQSVLRGAFGGPLAGKIGRAHV
jgi:hypothetical protein